MRGGGKGEERGEEAHQSKTVFTAAVTGTSRGKDERFPCGDDVVVLQ